MAKAQDRSENVTGLPRNVAGGEQNSLTNGHKRRESDPGQTSREDPFRQPEAHENRRAHADDEAVGAFGDTQLGDDPDGFRSGAGVRNGRGADYRADARDDRPCANRGIGHLENGVGSEGAKHGTVAQAVERRIEEGPKARTARCHPRECAVHGIAEHNDGQGDTALPDPPLRNTDDRDSDRRDGARDRHHVGGDAHARENASERRKDSLRDGTPVVSEHQSSFGQAAASRARASSRSSGTAFVCAIIGRKFASPSQRGTTCLCR